MSSARRSREIIQIFLVSFFFAFTLAMAAPLQIYLTNRLEFTFSSLDLVVALSPCFLCLLLASSGILCLLRGSGRETAVALLFALGMLLWVQGNLLVWDYGPLDGRDIDWKGLWLYGVLDSSIWVAGIAFAIYRRKWLSKYVIAFMSILFAVIQCFSLFLLARSPQPEETYHLDSRDKYTWSSRQNVLVLILDAFQTDVFQELIDEDPAIGNVFDGFVYFRNAASAFRQSHPSIASLLTATYYDNSVPMWDYNRDAYLSDSSLPRFLLEHGYRVDIYESKAGLFFDPRVVSNVKRDESLSPPSSEVWHAVDVALFRYLPQFLKIRVYNHQLWLLSRWLRDRSDGGGGSSISVGRQGAKSRTGNSPPGAKNSAQSRIDVFAPEALGKLNDVKFMDHFVRYSKVGFDQKTFKFYHLYGTHTPLRMTREFEYKELERTRNSVKEVAAGMVGLVGIMFDRLRDLGVFDESLIVVSADHGMWSNLAKVKIPEDIAKKYKTAGPVARSDLPELKGTALPLVLVKLPGSQGPLRISDVPVSLVDIPKTIASELGYESEAFPGKSMFEIAADSKRIRKVYYSTFKQNPAYSEPYRSTMKEYLVTGFSWLDSSWHWTGRIYPPGGADESTEGSKKKIPISQPTRR